MKAKGKQLSPIHMHKFSAEGPSNIQIEELPDIASLNPPNFEKQEWNISLPKTNNRTDDSTFVEDNFGINMHQKCHGWK